MFSDDQTIPCSVTQELVDAVASKSNKLIHNGRVKVREVLFLLGFQVPNYDLIKDVYVRNPARPYEVYQTNIYNGRLRYNYEMNALTGIMEKTNDLHFLKKAYVENEVLNVGNIPVTFMHNIVNIGEE